MPAAEGLKELAERKRLLLLEARLNRSLIAAECESLRERLGRVAGARENLVRAGPWLLAGGTAAAVLAARRWFPTALAMWRLRQKLSPACSATSGLKAATKGD
jgi:hypothetical protein